VEQTARENPFEGMLTIRQVAEFLQVSICTVMRWSNKGMLRFYRVGSRGDRRYQSEDVLRFLEESTRRLQPDNRSWKAPGRPA